jgi:hypothetical protein
MVTQCSLNKELEREMDAASSAGARAGAGYALREVSTDAEPLHD